MKRNLGVRLVALTLATTIGCGDDEGPVNLGGSDASPDAGSVSVARSTSEPATSAESSGLPSWTTTVATTSHDDGTLDTTAGNHSAEYDAGASSGGAETATTEVTTELTNTAGGNTEVTSAADGSSSVVVSRPDAGAEAGPPTNAQTSDQTSGDTATTAAETGLHCDNSEDCTPPSNPCLVAMCHDNVCMLMPIGSGEEARTQTPGDCRVLRCDGAGNSIDAADDNDVPEDGLDCTLDTCTNGVLEYPSATPGTACDDGSGTMCDDWGNCVECLAPSDRPGEDGECEWRTCIDNVCGVDSAGASTPLVSQILGNCATETCGGSLVDDDDTPNDGNECTADLCNDGDPSNPPLDLGESCQNNGTVCDGAGACVECNAGSECASGVCNYGACACASNGQCASGMCYDGSCVGSVNGCDITTAADYTSTPLTVTFANGNLTYAPQCAKVAVGATVTFNGSFSSHPLMGGRVVASSPAQASSGPFVPVTDSGSSKSVTMSAEGTFPYYCVPHGAVGMHGAIFVVPAPSN